MKTKLLETKFETAGRTKRKGMNQLIHVISRKIPSARRPIRCSPLARVFLLVPILLTSQVARATGNPNPGVIPPHARAHGLSYGEWGAQWWRWAYSFPAAQFPPSQSGEGDCSLGQSGSVWFLAGTTGQGPVTRSCTIPTGKALFFPIITYLNDYPCPDPNFQLPPGQTLEEFLTEGAAAIIDLVTELEVVVDGQPLNELFSYRATSRLFTFTADPSLVAFDPCVTGTPQFGVTDGYWILMNPLPPGPHTIFFRGKIDFGGGSTFESQVTYNLTVGHHHHP
jgi:hypothetical protein